MIDFALMDTRRRFATMRISVVNCIELNLVDDVKNGVLMFNAFEMCESTRRAICFVKLTSFFVVRRGKK